MPEKMSICLLSRYPPQKGGVATHAKALVESLKKRGHKITLITYGKMNRKEKGVRIIEVPILDMFFFRGLSYFLGTVQALKKYRDIDVVHAHPIHPAARAGSIASTSNQPSSHPIGEASPREILI